MLSYSDNTSSSFPVSPAAASWYKARNPITRSLDWPKRSISRSRSRWAALSSPDFKHATKIVSKERHCSVVSPPASKESGKCFGWGWLFRNGNAVCADCRLCALLVCASNMVLSTKCFLHVRKWTSFLARGLTYYLRVVVLLERLGALHLNVKKMKISCKFIGLFHIRSGH